MPSKTLISLLSDQTLPNVLFARELGPFNRHIFVSTDHTNSQRKPQALQETLGLAQAEVVRVVEDSPQDIQQRLSGLSFSDDEEIIVNLTGGTKIMAIGVYNFFLRRNSRMFYIPFPKNNIVQVHPEMMQKERPLAYRTSLEEYLQAYQIQVEPRRFARKNAHFGPPALAEQLYLAQGKRPFRQAWQPLRGPEAQAMLRQSGRLPLAGPDGDRVAQNFRQLGYRPQTAGWISAEEADYFAGQWLEVALYHRIRQALSLGDQAIGLNIEINSDGTSAPQANNEFDVLFVHDNKLYVVECKTGVGTLQQFNEYVYKLGALRDLFGLGVKPVLFVQQPTRPERRHLYESRCKQLKINFLDGSAFAQPSSFVSSLLR
jgi:hypothetical protein